jgi:peptidoglycan/LPS O-acetylase OafA/YrhL
VTRYDPALSGLRGLASLGVVMLHETYFAKFPFNVFPINALTLEGFLGVPIFLMMSMYLLLNRLDANTDLKHYFKRRIIRIWPIYYGTLIVAYFLFPFPFWAFVRYLFFVQYYASPAGYFPLWIFWTLQLEEAAYIAIPLIHRLRNKNLLGLGIILLGFGYLSYLVFFGSGFAKNISNLQILLPISLLGYGFGLLAYTGVFNSKKMRILALGGILGYFVWNFEWNGSLVYNSTMAYFVNDVLLYAVALTGFAYIVTHPPKFLGWFTLLGEESYALYAVHLAFVYFFGLAGLFYALGTAFAVELAARPKEMIKRIKRSYSEMLMHHQRKEIEKEPVLIERAATF